PRESSAITRRGAFGLLAKTDASGSKSAVVRARPGRQTTGSAAEMRDPWLRTCSLSPSWAVTKTLVAASELMAHASGNPQPLAQHWGRDASRWTARSTHEVPAPLQGCFDVDRCPPRRPGRSILRGAPAQVRLDKQPRAAPEANAVDLQVFEHALDVVAG